MRELGIWEGESVGVYFVGDVVIVALAEGVAKLGFES